MRTVRRRVLTSASLVLTLTAIVAAAASQSGGEPRQLAYVSGTVVRAGTGDAIANADVVLIRGGLLGRRSNVGPAPEATTALQGRFAFSGIEPDSYQLLVYVEFVPWGGRQMTLQPGERLEGIRVVVTPTGSVGGRVYDETGKPVEGVRVYRFRIREQGSRRQLGMARTGQVTDENGDYLFKDLSPGEYGFRAEPWRSRLRSPETDRPYAPAYYPGVTDPALAATVELLPGAAVSNADIRFDATETFSISGQILNTVDTESSQPVERLYLIPSEVDVLLPIRRSGLRNMAEESDRFEVRNVPPGSYDLYPNWRSDGSGYTSRTIVHVVDRDIEDLSIPIPPGVTIRAG